MKERLGERGRIGTDETTGSGKNARSDEVSRCEVCESKLGVSPESWHLYEQSRRGLARVASSRAARLLATMHLIPFKLYVAGIIAR